MTTARNSYATLADYKNYAKTRAVTAPVDSTDDAVIEIMLEAASREYEDDHYHRQFYPTIETLTFDIPEARFLYFNEKNLLEVISFLNGDSSAIASSEYLLVPNNIYPKYGLSLRDVSTTYFVPTTAGSYNQALSISGVWGFHDRYATDAWVLASTLSEDLDVSETVWDVGALTNFSAGQIIRVDNELCIITSTATDTAGNHLTITTRGDNGSTAATHTTGTKVYFWSPMTQVRQDVLERVNVRYQARSQTSIGAENPARRWQSERSKA